MLNRTCLFVLFFCFAQPIYAANIIRADSIVKLVSIGNKNLRNQKLVIYLSTYFPQVPLSDFEQERTDVDGLFTKYKIAEKPAFDYFIESMYQRRISHYAEAEDALVDAIQWSQKMSNHYLIYAFFSHKGFLQTFLGNTAGAVSSFRMAKREAVLLNDAKLQVLIDINISDLYYRNTFYSQSLYYLDQADSILANTSLREQRLNNAVNSNKAESYFRMGNLNMLREVDGILYAVPGNNKELYSYKKRTDYYIMLLEQDYKKAANQLLLLKKDSAYAYDSTDEQNLADTYYKQDKLDSAKTIFTRLLGTKEQQNHPEVNFHLYAVLGEIAQKQHDYEEAASNFKLAFEESERNLNRITKVGDISSEIKADELEGFYVKKEGGYKRERVWLVIAVTVSVLMLTMVALFYRNIKQKRYYEKLLFAAQKEELAFINSHEVRRHLSNILGIIDTINHSEDKDEAYLQAEQHLLSAAKSLDDAIKNISEKLNN